MRTERGSVTPLVALAMVAAGGTSVLLGRLGEAGVARAGARTAADAAALAGVADGEEAAREVASANGATVLDYQVMGSDTRVVVRLGSAEASARARRRGLEGRGGSGAGAAGSSSGLASAMTAALARAEQLLGEPVPITSGFRSSEEQAALYAGRHANPFPVAPPGSSMHERGLAVDVPSAFVPRLLSVAGRAGLCQPHPESDPIHFEVC
ncbi:MAG: M15 family metallopeptidase [Acidimicrobiales bacterium]